MTKCLRCPRTKRKHDGAADDAHRHRARPWSCRPVRRNGHRDPARGRGGICFARGRGYPGTARAGRRGRLRPRGVGQRDREPAGRLGHRPHVGGCSRVRDRGPDARRRDHVPARRGVVHDHRGRRDPGDIRRAGSHLGRPDRARHVRAAGDRRLVRAAGPGGPAVGPVGRSGARAGLRAEPGRGDAWCAGYVRSGTGLGRGPGRIRAYAGAYAGVGGHAGAGGYAGAGACRCRSLR